jgi:hypothetical protein
MYHRFYKKQPPHPFKITETSEFEELRNKIYHIMSEDKSFDYARFYTLKTLDLQHYEHIIPEFKEKIERQFSLKSFIKMKNNK